MDGVDRATEAWRAGCCLASCKEDCTQPPCPVNLDAWTKAERDHIARERRFKALKEGS